MKKVRGSYALGVKSGQLRLARNQELNMAVRRHGAK